MKSIKAILFTGGLAGILIITAAFVKEQHSNNTSNWQTPETNKGFAVVELFTSEGCSSCPPADELVKKIQEENSNKPIYILAFHVDYWDHQGWKDRFSDRDYSNRQRQYASWLNVESVYTPQIVVNGRAEFVGTDQQSIQQAIATGLGQERASALTINGKIAGNKVSIEYEGAGEEKRSELVLALIQKSAQSRVKAGENAGSNLSHVQIVRKLLHLSVDKNSKKSITMDLPDGFTPKEYELIGFVQNKTDGQIISATRFEL